MNNQQQNPQRAAVYTRISDDREGEGAGVARQESDARALAIRLGWTVGAVITENDQSAYKRRKVRLPDGRTELRVIRPGFRHLLDLINSGQVDGLIAYDLDRTARDPRDLEDLIDAVEGHRPWLPVESVTGSLRLGNDSDVTMARMMVAVANKSSRDTARRVARKHEELALEGRFSGGGARRYGYERDGVTVREGEAEVIRMAAARVLAGDSAHAICRDLDASGIRPVKAATWSTKTLIDMLRSARIAGLRVYLGEVVGEAAWPAIIDMDTHHALVAELNSRSRGRGKPALIRWLNGVLWCGKCGHHLSGASAAGSVPYRYWCDSTRGGCGGIGIHGPKVEAEIERQVLGFLARRDVLAALAEGRTAAAAEDTRAAIAEDEKQLRDLATMFAEKRITLGEWTAAREVIDKRLKGAQGALLAVVPDRVRAVLSADDQEAAWAALGPADRREVALVILHSAGLKGWTVAPADLGKPRAFDPTRLSLAPVDD